MRRPKRRGIWAIYVWCRRTDEADWTAPRPRPCRGLAWRSGWISGRRATAPSQRRPVIVMTPSTWPLVDTLERFPQPLQPYLDIIEGPAHGPAPPPLRQLQDLELYCYRVLATVGLMTQEWNGSGSAYTSAPGANGPTPPMPPWPSGIANQLTNILPGCGGEGPQPRVRYLPSPGGSVRFNYSEADLMPARCNDNWRALMAFQLLCVPGSGSADSEAGVRWLAADARWAGLASLPPVFGHSSR